MELSGLVVAFGGISGVGVRDLFAVLVFADVFETGLPPQVRVEYSLDNCSVTSFDLILKVFILNNYLSPLLHN